jgi:hypothetical protein
LAQLANRPHTYLPLQVFNEADEASQLFQYYLLDTSGFQPNVFTAIIPGVNDGNVQLTATGGDCGLPTLGAVRVVLEPKPGLPTDPNNPRAFNDVFTDISPLFVINNESGWYEGWMLHDITVPNVAAPRKGGHAQFGTLTQRDADILKRMGTGNNVAGNIFTVDGQAPHFPSASDHFPDKQTNVVPINESMGAYNAFQQSDVHSYWEFNYLGTNWIHPLYELPFTGGFPGRTASARRPHGGAEVVGAVWCHRYQPRYWCSTPRPDFRSCPIIPGTRLLSAIPPRPAKCLGGIDQALPDGYGGGLHCRQREIRRCPTTFAIRWSTSRACRAGM